MPDFALISTCLNQCKYQKQDFLISLLMDFFDMYSKFDIGIECIKQGATYENLVVVFGPIEYSQKQVIIKLSLPITFPFSPPRSFLYVDTTKTKLNPEAKYLRNFQINTTSETTWDSNDPSTNFKAIPDEIGVLFMQNEPIVGEVHNLGIWKQGVEDQPPNHPKLSHSNHSEPAPKYGFQNEEMKEVMHARSETIAIPEQVIRASLLQGIQQKIEERVDQDFDVTNDEFKTVSFHYKNLKNNAAALRRMQRIYDQGGLQEQLKRMRNSVAMMEQARAVKNSLDTASWEEMLLLPESDKKLIEVKAEIWALNNLNSIMRDAIAHEKMSVEEVLAEIRKNSVKECHLILLQQKILSSVAGQ